jgi:hypothetical protein
MINPEHTPQPSSEGGSDSQMNSGLTPATESIGAPLSPGEERSPGKTEEKILCASEYEALKIKEHSGQTYPGGFRPASNF